ncbi:nitroreductase family protein [Curtobacterium sp. MCBD17_035]|uniref:nitroreductase family protein n=1 Tax=Curtobacterium sp. MCBD17_035 TaxID=2175673 RepID=UPI000DAA4790|nr:nitroreductase family protein [Curtobacterium sp. MCBD17_035]WIB67931.1 nitroreductase family protein [Curtobacterium sp. MCBD17_035]
MTATSDTTTLTRSTDSSRPLVPLLEERWSPRSFDETATIDDDTVTTLLEAARWAPSASNTQPRRFVVGRRGTPTFDVIMEHLMGFNQAWAHRASALVVAIAETADEDGQPRRWAEYDLGQAIAALSVQAHAEGLHVHQLGGIDVDGLRTAFALPERFVPVTVTAIGTVADPSQLDEQAAARELAPRTRLPLDELVLARD